MSRRLHARATWAWLGLLVAACAVAGCSNPLIPDLAERYHLERVDGNPVPGTVLGEWVVRGGNVSFSADGTCFRFQTTERIGVGSPSLRISMSKCRWAQEGGVIILSWENRETASQGTLRGTTLTLELRAGEFCLDQACDADWSERYVVSASEEQRAPGGPA